jgi:predicted ester cyclase
MSDLLSLVHGAYAANNSGDLEAARPYFAEDVETVTPQGVLSGFEAWKEMGGAFLTAVPDMHHDIVRTFEDGDTIVVEGIYSGTHTGPLATPDGTLPPSGNRFALPYVDLFEVHDGVCTSHRVYWDNVTLMSQLGAMAPA